MERYDLLLDYDKEIQQEVARSRAGFSPPTQANHTLWHRTAKRRSKQPPTSSPTPATGTIHLTLAPRHPRHHRRSQPNRPDKPPPANTAETSNAANPPPAPPTHASRGSNGWYPCGPRNPARPGSYAAKTAAAKSRFRACAPPALASLPAAPPTSKPRLDPLHPPRKIRIPLPQRPLAMHMVRQHHPPVHMKRSPRPLRPHSLPQRRNLRLQQVRSPVTQSHREEIAPARHPITPIRRHSPAPANCRVPSTPTLPPCSRPSSTLPRREVAVAYGHP
jgi:hypothetical protein